MTGLVKRCIVPLVAAAIALLAVLLWRVGKFGGGDKTPPGGAFVPRTEDAAYQQELRDILKARNVIAADRTATVREMRALVERARAALPPDATEADVQKELEDNPSKYPGWRDLTLHLRQVNAAAETDLAKARATVGARIRREVAEKNAARRPGTGRPTSSGAAGDAARRSRGDRPTDNAVSIGTTRPVTRRGGESN